MTDDKRETNVSEGEVEAACDEFIKHLDGGDTYRAMTAALAAVVPMLRERLAQEVEGEIRADERERLANEAYERGDIGTETGPDVWVWLLGPGAATATPKRRLRITRKVGTR